MQTTKPSSHPVLSQTRNNTTLWIGHLQADANDRFAGQTFTCPADGLLNNIQVYSTTVHHPGDVAMTLHEFDPAARTWGAAIGDAIMSLEKNDDARWLRFNLQPVALKRDATYGFRLQSRNAMIGLGEAASDSKQPFTGHEWNGNSKNEQGYYFTYFSLAYKIEMCA
ncbi:MAG: hypothetical protein ABIR30_00320 [Chitinophagaceae bacterium]